jgi:hypothetical protein
MLRRSISKIALAIALFTIGLYAAGSPAATAITFGLLIFLALVAVMFGWQSLKDEILEEVEQSHGQVLPGVSHQESADRHELRDSSRAQTDPLVRFQLGPVAEIDWTPARRASALQLSRPLPYDVR